MVGGGENRRLNVPGHTQTFNVMQVNYGKVLWDKSAMCIMLRVLDCSAVPRNFFGGGGQQIKLSTEERENGDLGAVAP